MVPARPQRTASNSEQKAAIPPPPPPPNLQPHRALARQPLRDGDSFGDVVPFDVLRHVLVVNPTVPVAGHLPPSLHHGFGSVWVPLQRLQASGKSAPRRRCRCVVNAHKRTPTMATAYTVTGSCLRVNKRCNRQNPARLPYSYSVSMFMWRSPCAHRHSHSHSHAMPCRQEECARQGWVQSHSSPCTALRPRCRSAATQTTRRRARCSFRRLTTGVTGEGREARGGG